MLELSLGVGACGRMASPSPPTPWVRRVGRLFISGGWGLKSKCDRLGAPGGGVENCVPCVPVCNIWLGRLFGAPSGARERLGRCSGAFPGIFLGLWRLRGRFFGGCVDALHRSEGFSHLGPPERLEGFLGDPVSLLTYSGCSRGGLHMFYIFPSCTPRSLKPVRGAGDWVLHGSLSTY